jgi:enamine deaminase RidA (YjgF/YER057c/UK114 family)
MTAAVSSSIDRLNPDTLPPALGYCQVTVAEGTRLVHVSGQVGIGADGELAGPDHRSQFEQAMRNVVLGLEAAGATIHDAVKTTVYVVDLAPEVMGAFAEASAAVYGAEPPTMAVTFIGISTLPDPHHKVEIEATAVLP